MGIKRLIALSVPLVSIVVIAAVATASGGGGEPSPPDPVPVETSEGRPATQVIPGYEACEVAQVSADCEVTWVNLDFFATVTHDKSVKYPSDYGLPACPAPAPDGGFAPGEDANDQVLDAAPECAVHPRFAVVRLYMTSAAAARFSSDFGCGQAEDVCTVEDV